MLDKNKKLITEINSKKAKEMINDDIISGGMIPKVNNCAARTKIQKTARKNLRNKKKLPKSS